MVVTAVMMVLVASATSEDSGGCAAMAVVVVGSGGDRCGVCGDGYGGRRVELEVRRLEVVELPTFGSSKTCFLYNPVDTDFLKVQFLRANVKLKRMEEIGMMALGGGFRLQSVSKLISNLHEAFTHRCRVCKARPLEDKTLDLHLDMLLTSRHKASLPTKNLLTLRATCHGEKILLYNLQLTAVTTNDTYIYIVIESPYFKSSSLPGTATAILTSGDLHVKMDIVLSYY
ncbi:hypothetical protein Tco_1128002 [Tanacetum coccineum]